MTARPRREWRPALILVLLSLSVVSAVLLALQVQQAVSEHRRAMVGTLRDDASLAAAEYIRRACMQVGYQGIASDMGRLAAGETANLRIAGPLLERVGGELRLGGIPVEGELEAWLDARLARAVAEGKERERAFTVVHDVRDGEPRSFAFLSEPIHDRKRPGSAILGFALRLSDLPSFLEKPLARTPLIPESLAKGTEPVGNGFLAVTVRDPRGAAVFRSREPFPGGVTVDAPFGDTYEGVLAGYTADVTLDPAAAPLLLAGGLPKSRLPFLLLLLLLSAGVTAAAILQLRRERAFLRLREEFVASVSHELRTPLTQIRMFAETLLLAARARRRRRRGAARSSTGRRGGSRTWSRTCCSSRASRRGGCSVIPRTARGWRRWCARSSSVPPVGGHRGASGLRWTGRDGARAGRRGRGAAGAPEPARQRGEVRAPRAGEVRVGLDASDGVRAARGRGRRPGHPRRGARARLHALRAAGARPRAAVDGAGTRTRGGAGARRAARRPLLDRGRAGAAERGSWSSCRRREGAGARDAHPGGRGQRDLAFGLRNNLEIEGYEVEVALGRPSRPDRGEPASPIWWSST